MIPKKVVTARGVRAKKTEKKRRGNRQIRIRGRKRRAKSFVPRAAVPDATNQKSCQ